MVKTLYIHAGFPKSGTTALQAALRENQELLLAEGVLYPESPNNAHHKIVSGLLHRNVGWRFNQNVGWSERKRNSERWDKFVQTVSNSSAEKILISSEFLTGAKIEEIEKIKSSFPNFQIKVIFTLRSIFDMIPSYYQQSLKKGSVLTFLEWMNEKFFLPSGNLRDDPKLMHYARTISRWVQVFGNNNIYVLISDSKNHDILYQNFAEVINVSELPQAKNMTLNRSMTVREAEILRLINVSVIDKWDWYSYCRIVRDGFVKRLTNTKNSSNRAESRFTVPIFMIDHITHIAERIISEIEMLDVVVLGDLSSISKSEKKIYHDFEMDLETAKVESVVHLKQLSREYLNQRKFITRVKMRLKSFIR
jgi:hypothetical protein